MKNGKRFNRGKAADNRDATKTNAALTNNEFDDLTFEQFFERNLDVIKTLVRSAAVCFKKLDSQYREE